MKSRKLMRVAVVTLIATLTHSVRLNSQEMTPTNANPVPLINYPLVPDAATPGGEGFTLTLNGTGFVSSSIVNWNGHPLVTMFISGSQLTTSVPASDIANSNTSAVTVVNSSPGGGTSNVAFFEVTIPTSTIALTKSDYSAGSGPVSVAAADFDQDGALDLGATNVFSNTVSVLLGNGDGTFRRPTDYGTGIEPASVAVGDFTGGR
jgi:hypothetical protein